MKKGDEILAIVDTWQSGNYQTVRVVATARIVRVSGSMLWWRAAGAVNFFKHSIKAGFDERGLTWVPAWREVEVAAFRTACALGGVT